MIFKLSVDHLQNADFSEVFDLTKERRTSNKANLRILKSIHKKVSTNQKSNLGIIDN